MSRLFGADGVRGVVQRELDATLVYNLGRAVSYVLTGGAPGEARLGIGRDTRLSGDMLESALVAGVCSTGADCILFGVQTTPAVSLLTRHLGLDGGFVVTASHNPNEYNGVKIFNQDGIKLTDSLEDEIERIMQSSDTHLAATFDSEVGRKHVMDGATTVYLDHLKRAAPRGLEGLKLVLDCANGAAFAAAPALFTELGAEVIAINNSPTGRNINLNCGAVHPEELQRVVVASEADAGLAFDGDADRLIAVDEKGCTVSGDCTIGILAKYFNAVGKLKHNTVVTTPMSNIGLDSSLEREGCRVVKARIGDRYVLQEMLENGYNLGGEWSGHVIFLDHATTSDGLLTALQLLGVMRATGKTISQLASEIKEVPRILINARVRHEQKYRYHQYPDIAKRVFRIESMVAGRGRFYIRPASTEPLIRLLLEAEDITDAIHEVQALQRLMESRLS